MNASRLIMLFLLLKAGACYAAEIKAIVKVARRSSDDSKVKFVRVFARQVDIDELIDFSPAKIALSDTENKFELEWTSPNLSKGEYDIQVRDEPTMMGSLIFAIKRVRINDIEEKINLNFALEENNLLIFPTLGGKQLEMGQDGGIYKSYSILLERKGVIGEVVQIQKNLIFKIGKDQKIASRLYFISEGVHSVKLLEITSGERPSNREWEKKIYIPAPVPDEIKIDFVEKQ